MQHTERLSHFRLAVMCGSASPSRAESNMLTEAFSPCVVCFPAEIEKYEGNDVRKDGEERKKYLDIISNKNIKLSERVLIPVQQYPKVR